MATNREIDFPPPPPWFDTVDETTEPPSLPVGDITVFGQVCYIICAAARAVAATNPIIFAR